MIDKTLPSVLMTVMLCLIGYVPVYGQVQVSLNPSMVSADTTYIDVELSTADGSDYEPVSSFQFAVQADSDRIQFAGLKTEWTLTGENGWRARANPDNGRVGGFSSQLDAFNSPGVLVTLLFTHDQLCGESVNISLDILKLNTGSPPHHPSVPFTTLRFSDCE